MRLVWIAFALGLLVIVPFAIWGESFEAALEPRAAAEWLESHGAAGWLIAIALLVGDLVLPIPATAVLSALGLVYGALVGGLIGTIGFTLSGVVAYWLARVFGRDAARRIAGEKDLERGDRIFASVGGWVVALSRWLPVFPEVVSCLAGLSRMPALAFHTALLCGSAPLAFTFAAIGAAGHDRPGLAIGLSAGLPVVLWAAASIFIRRSRKGGAGDAGDD